jgi:hypothetical protein
MTQITKRHKMSTIRIVCGIVLIVVGGAIGCVSSPQTLLERLGEARRLTAEILVQFTKAADAGNRAVMADSGDAAAANVSEANQANDAVQTSVAQLRPILADLGYSQELQLLDEFGGRFAKYRELDRTIADMAVESTNLKAQRLAFGPGWQQADAFEDALRGVIALASAGDRTRIEGIAARAVSAVREIQALQAPHIAEAGEGRMTDIEKRMTAAESTARRSLTALAELMPPPAEPNIAAASAAFDRFVSLSAEIVTLSRRNSNVHALALSLGQKRTLVAACEESLRALQDALAKRGFTGTR